MNSYLKRKYQKNISEYNINKDHLNIFNLITDIHTTWHTNSDKDGKMIITYNFPDWSNMRWNGEKYNSTITTFNSVQKELAKKALQQWEEVCNIKFFEKPPSADTHIKFGAYNNIIEFFSTATTSIKGFAYFPSLRQLSNKALDSFQDYSIDGQVWINFAEFDEVEYIKKSEITPLIQDRITYYKRVDDKLHYAVYEDEAYYYIYKNKQANMHNDNNYTIGDIAYTEHVFRHEIGHALGLKHSFISKIKKNASENEIEYAKSLNDLKENSYKYSVMAYNPPLFEDGDFQSTKPMTPMLLDILSIQYLYGKNTTTRKNDTTYGFNSNTDKDQFSLNSQEDKIVACIWDADGNDTFDFSQYHDNQKINLNEATFSDVGGLRGNVSIAYGVIIENATGGYGNDNIIGNEANNILRGGKGHDILVGQGGHDIIYGNDGNDKLYGSFGDDQLYGGIGNDMLYDSMGDNYLSGAQGDDTLIVRNGNNTLIGDEGNDYLNAGYGNNLLYGGSGNDTFAFELSANNFGNNTIVDFYRGEDKLEFFIWKDNSIKYIKPHITNKFSGSANEVIIKYEKQQNTENKKQNFITKLEINTQENTLASNLSISLEGYYSADDLFNV